MYRHEETVSSGKLNQLRKKYRYKYYDYNRVKTARARIKISFNSGHNYRNITKILNIFLHGVDKY